MKLPKLQDTSGKESSSFTMAVIAFTAVTLWLLAYVIAPFFGITNVPEFDGVASMAYLSPLLALYYGRRQSKDNATPAQNQGDIQP